jgi:CubicO group peptidase (beta-lactamase class C family)
MNEVLERAAGAGIVPGVVALAADDAGVFYEGAFGTREAGTDRAMTADTVVWIASMTKAVTSVAAMQLVERGKLALDEPLGGLLPELASLQVLDGFEAGGAPRLRPARRPVTLRHLLTHTSGFTYNIWNGDMARYMTHHDIPAIVECRSVSLGTPLVADPGDRWEYGIGVDWAARAVEKASDLSLEEYFRANVFDPLGMRDTAFILGPDQRARLSAMHRRKRDGSLAAIRFEVNQRPEFFMGGGGLYSTGPDYLAFLRMLLGGGSLEGVRLLRPETVADMGRNHTGAHAVGALKTALPSNSNDAEFFPGMRKHWGLGFLITGEDAHTGRSAGSLAWAGLANTYYWIDPTRRVTGVLLTQILPFADAGALAVFEDFERAVYASLRT